MERIVITPCSFVSGTPRKPQQLMALSAAICAASHLANPAHRHRPHRPYLLPQQQWDRSGSREPSGLAVPGPAQDRVEVAGMGFDLHFSDMRSALLSVIERQLHCNLGKSCNSFHKTGTQPPLLSSPPSPTISSTDQSNTHQLIIDPT